MDKELKKVCDKLYKMNKGNYYIDYLISEGTVSIDWYKAILKKVKEYKPKRVIDIGSCLNFFGYLFENEGIEYIGIEIELDGCKPITTDKIKMINDNYYNVRDEFKDDICISCLCAGYLIPYEDIRAKHLIVDDFTKINNKNICSAKVVF